MTQIAIVETTFASREEAVNLAKQIVELKLGACCHIIPNVASIFTWENRLEESQEVILRIKTFESLLPRLVDFVRSHHSYSVPELFSCRVSCLSDPYRVWMEESLQ